MQLMPDFNQFASFVLCHCHDFVIQFDCAGCRMGYGACDRSCVMFYSQISGAEKLDSGSIFRRVGEMISKQLMTAVKHCEVNCIP